jgi:hypothetical protein
MTKRVIAAQHNTTYDRLVGPSVLTDARRWRGGDKGDTVAPIAQRKAG